MPTAIDFLNALFGAYEGDIVFDRDGKFLSTSNRFFTENTPDLSVRPLTSAGVHFVYSLVDSGPAPINATSCRLKPSAILFRDNQTLLIWGLEASALLTNLNLGILREAFGIGSFEEMIPMPGTDGWELEYLDVDSYWSLEKMVEVYGVDALEENLDTSVHEAPDTDDVERYLDAVVMTPGGFDQSVEILNKDIVITAGPNRESKRWKPLPQKLRQFVAKLCKHEVGTKDGLSFVLGDMVEGQRLKSAVKALYATGLDIDTGTPSSVVDAALSKLGVFAVRYTTHSHRAIKSEFKKDAILKFAPDEEIDTALVRRFLGEVQQWDQTMIDSAEYVGTEHIARGIMVVVEHHPMPKHRIVIPFAEPFRISEQGKTQQEAMVKWAKVPAALAAELRVPFDKSCVDPSRLFYFPRHGEGRPFEIRLWTGKLFDWQTLELDNPYDIKIEEDKGKSKSVTPEGRVLGKWSIDRAPGFQIVDAIENFAPDRKRGPASGRGITIECPFDEDHSNAGDQADTGCFAVNAGDGPSEIFTVSCRHESCRNKTVLDMLGKMIKDGWLPADIIKDEDYNSLIIEGDATTQPKPRTEPKTESRKEKPKKTNAPKNTYEAAIETLTLDSDDEAIDAILQMLCEAKLGGAKIGAMHKRMSKLLGCSIADIRKQFSRVKNELQRIQEDGEERESDRANDPLNRHTFRYRGEFHFDEAWRVCDRALLRTNVQEGMPVYSHVEGKPVRLHINPRDKRIMFEPLDPIGIWAELNTKVTFVKQGDEVDSARQQVPLDVAKQVAAQFYKTFPASPEVVYTPIFIADGRLVNKPGYYYDKNDPDFNFLLADTGFEVAEVYPDPSATEAQEALEWIRTEILVDFPFLDFDSQGEEHRGPSEANALAMLITPFMRRMINGCTPVFFVSKPQPGTGGTLLGSVPIMLFDGIEMPPVRYSQNEEEMNKVLIAAIMETRSHLFFDDVKEFNNRELLRAITSPYIGGRILGSSRTIERPNNFNWVATSNNPFVMNEMERRVVWIKLNLKNPDVQNRKFRHANLTTFIKENRAVAVHKILTLIQYWVSCNMPKFKGRSRASFEDWGEKVGGVLMTAGIEGFLDNRREVGQDLNEAGIKSFVRAWLTKYGLERRVLPSDLFRWALDSELDIIEGNNDDQKKAKFVRTLPTINERTFLVDDIDCMVRSGFDADQNAAYYLTRINKKEKAA